MNRPLLPLSIALSDNAYTRPIIDGAVTAQAVELLPTAVHPSEMFWRQLRFGDFDISEMSMSSLLIATARGAVPWVAIPVFTSRDFFHTRVMVARNSSIANPAELRGKRVGVPEYQQTAAIWGRGVLQHEFGVHPREINWFMERVPARSHAGATGFKPPEGVRINQIAATTDIGEMLVRGELDATLLYLAERNLVDRSHIDLAASGVVRPLFSDRAAEGRRYFAKTGIYPINHTVVLRRALAEKHPWLALNLYAAFIAAKKSVRDRTEAGLRAHFDVGLLDEKTKGTLAADPMAYGVTAARRVIETIADYVHEQGLAPRKVGLEEIFAPNTLDL
ncbi:MAG: hypothetical protein HY056_15820 [Proteobacteria bacterium]|nr:hypothetical protein [Pseudomonadota bacterium]